MLNPFQQIAIALHTCLLFETNEQIRVNLALINISKASKWKALVLMIVSVQYASALQCPHSTTSSAGPGLPYLPDSFQVSVECNILDKGYTSTAKMYYDFPGNRGTVKYFANGVDRSLIFSYTTDELFSVTSDYCIVSNLTTSNLTALFGEIYNNGMPHIAHVQDALRFGKQLGEVYIGNDTIRGIPVNHWQACSNFSQWTSIVIDYYFSANWSTASTFTSVPVRAEVKSQSTLPNGTTYSLHHIYDYFDFIPDIEEDDTIFQTPPGVLCPGRKSTKKLPVLPKNFYYRVEKVFTDLSALVFEDIWYDSDFNLYRHDYRPFAPEEPLNTVNPTTEVHDYNTGVRYVMDRSTKNCQVVPISNYSMDASQNITARKINGSFMINMRNPLQLFNLDSNYTYIGQTYTRNILCDVYMARRNDLFIDGFVSYSNLTITFYFMAAGWTDLSDNLAESIESVRDKYGTPIQMDLLADETTLSMSYNFLDFTPESPDFNLFDVSQCYPESRKVTFQVTFPGTLQDNNAGVLTEWAHLIFAQDMGVSPLRITNMRLDNDDANIFITATLLDKVLPTAEFTSFPNRSVERQDNLVIKNTMSPIECAEFCVEAPVLRCESFDYCQDMTCRMSSTPLSEGPVLVNSSICNHFARTVKALRPEKSILDAFDQLRTRVYNKTLHLKPSLAKSYTAIDVKIIFGWLNPRVVLPAVPSQFSYKVEVTIPSSNNVLTTAVWYDDGFKMLRYDTHSRVPAPPYYTTNPLSIIEDYNTGIKYVIDKEYQNCTVARITADEQEAYLSPNTSRNSTWVLMMKDPFSSFALDNTYKYVGQQTIRGMTCNLFESLRSDFPLPNGRLVKAVYRYAFLSDQWSETSDDYLGSVGQPVRLDATILDTNMYLQFNFFDFDTDHPDIRVYDIHQCNTEGKWKHFTVQFPGPFDPYLDTSSRIFLLEGLFRLSALSNTSILRLQRYRMDRDAVNIYLSATLADRPKTSFYFTKIPTNNLPERADKVLTISDEEQCTDACQQETSFQCNSFYFCQGTSQCLLSAQHVPDDPNSTAASECFSYSRTVDDNGIPISTTYAYKLLKNSVYIGNFSINIPIANSVQSRNYTATGIREQFTNSVETSAGEKALLEFNKVSDHASLMNDPAKSTTDIAIDECALACLEENTFNCNAFSYSLHKQICYMVSGFGLGKDSLLINVTSTPSYLYSRKYTNMYTLNGGVTTQGQADSLIPSISTDDDCGQLCVTNKGFKCRVFQYCPNTKQCLLFKDRTLIPANQTNSVSTSTCYQYTSKLLVDFQTVNAGQFKFTNVLSVEMIKLEACADICVQEMGINCKGFYYSATALTCYLTSAVVGDGSGTVTTGQFPSFLFCDVYKRIYFPPSTSSSVSTQSTKSAQPTVASSTSSTASSLTKTGSSRPTTTPLKSSSSPVTCVPPSTPAPGKPSVVIRSSATLTTTNTVSGTTSAGLVVNTAAPQSENSGVTSGLAAGIAFITFVVGIVVGVLTYYTYRRFRGVDEMNRNFIHHEEI